MEPPKKLNPPSRLLNTADIEGAGPKRPKQWIKPQGPVDGTTSQRRIPLNVAKKNDFNISNKDIPHSYPENKLFTTNRVVNPLQPVYHMSSYEVTQSTPTKQLRETNLISDIQGTKATSCHKMDCVRTRSTMTITDILGASCKSKNSILNCSGRSLNLTTKDINHPENIKSSFTTNRCTNPLSPRYRVANPAVQGTVLTLDGNHPKKLPKEKQPHERCFTLRSTDIPGGTPSRPVPFPQARRHWKETCALDDMPFCKPSAKYNTMHSSSRKTDPNNPRYVPLASKVIHLPSA